MFPGFEKIVEEKIVTAQKNGAFDNLEGMGKPLQDDDFKNVPEDLKIAYKILKNADFLPPEIELKKEIKTTEELLSNTFDLKKRYKIIKKINFLIMKLNVLGRKSPELEVPQLYFDKIVEKYDR